MDKSMYAKAIKSIYDDDVIPLTLVIFATRNHLKHFFVTFAIML